MINTVTAQITDESGLVATTDIQDLVIITYVGLLDSPPSTLLTQDRLLKDARRNLIIWVWEQGVENEPLPTLRSTAAEESPLPAGVV